MSGEALTRRQALELLGVIAAMAMIPENPVVGGTVLRRAAIQSPNFATGLTGWSVNQDGSAEFNNLTIRNGQVISGTALYYSSSPPAFGTLVASVAATGGTDSKGNAYVGGVTSYFIGASNIAVQLAAGQISFLTAAGAGGPWSVQSKISVDSTGTILELTGGTAGHISANQLLNAIQGLGVSGGLTVAGGTTADKTSISDAISTANPVLEVVNTLSSITPLLRETANAVGDLWWGGRVSGDTSSRLVLDTQSPAGAPRIRFGPGNAGPDTILARFNANQLQVLSADLDIATLGRGLQIKEGASARMGQAALVGGTVTVTNTTVTGSTRFFLSRMSAGGTLGHLSISSVTIGTNFVIGSSNAADTSTVNWLLIEPG